MTDDLVGRPRAPWYRKPLCWAGLCHTFRTNSDDEGVWGECSICHRRAGYVDRAALRRIADAETRAALAKDKSDG